jgi:hypothetical protein
MAEMVFLGHYAGYIRDRGLTEAGYPFEQYIADLKAGGDRSYTIWGPRLDGSDEEFKVDPRKPVEYVTTNKKVDPDGNGRGTTLLVNNSSLGYAQLENGGLRIVDANGISYKDYFEFCGFSSMGLNGSLFALGVPSFDFLQGHIPLMPPQYPATRARLDAIYFDDQIWKDSNGLLGPGVLVP